MEPLISNNNIAGTNYSKINTVELNRRMMRMGNVEFYLTIHGLIKFRQQKMFMILESLSDEVISRILYDTLRGLNIVEDIFYTVILPTFIYCVRYNKLHLITPNFNFLKYLYGNINDIYQMLDVITHEIVHDVVFDIKMELLEKGDPLAMEPDFGPNNELFTDNEDSVIFLARELSKFFHPFMKIYLSNISNYELPDLFEIFKKEIIEKSVLEMGQTFYDVGMNYAFVRMGSFGGRVLSLFNDDRMFSQINNKITFKEIIEKMAI